MAEEYEWRITLADDSVVDETDGPYQLTWELEGAVKKFELIGEKEMSINLETAEFTIDGTTHTVKGIKGDHTDKALWFRKRKQVQTDGTSITPPITNYLFGFIWQGDLYEAGVRPNTVAPEKIAKPKKYKKHN